MAGKFARFTGTVLASARYIVRGLSRLSPLNSVDSLAEQGPIQREEPVCDGHNTYYLTPVPRDLDFSLLMAGDVHPPFIDEEEVDSDSEIFSQWIMNLAYEG